MPQNRKHMLESDMQTLDKVKEQWSEYVQDRGVIWLQL